MRYDSCRQCTKRRIKCDKGTPRCAKCIKKGLECSGIGKTYQFVENATPETIESSWSVRKRHSEPCHDERGAFDGASDTAVHLNSQSVGNDSTGFILDGDDDHRILVSSQSGAQQSVDDIVMHQQIVPGVIATQTTQSPLDYTIALYKPGQMMLLDHCKLALSCIYGAMTVNCFSCFQD